MTSNQKKILTYLKEILDLKKKEINLEYDENSVVIIDNLFNLTLIFHFIYMEGKILLINDKPRGEFY